MEITGDSDKTLKTHVLSKTRCVRTHSLLSLAGCSPAIPIVSHFLQPACRGKLHDHEITEVYVS